MHLQHSKLKYQSTTIIVDRLKIKLKFVYYVSQKLFSLTSFSPPPPFSALFSLVEWEELRPLQYYYWRSH